MHAAGNGSATLDLVGEAKGGTEAHLASDCQQEKGISVAR